MEETEWAYLAGFIDGDGSIGILTHPRKSRGNRMHMTPRITLTNRSHLVMQWAKERLGSVIHATKPKEGNLRARGTSYRIEWRGMKKAQQILPNIIPYLIIKKERAETVMEFVTWRTNKRRGYNPPIDKQDLLYGLLVKKMNAQHGNALLGNTVLLEELVESMTSQLKLAISSRMVF